MKQDIALNPGQPSRWLWIIAATFLVSCASAYLIARYGVDQHVDSLTLPVAGRTLNQFMAVLLTCIALILPLTANLYTPRLVSLYVRHPLIVSMLVLLLFSQIICLVLNFLPVPSRLNHILVGLLTLIYLLVILGALPFLYGISRFLRPIFFVPMLTQKGVQSLGRLARGDTRPVNGENLFHTVDVVTNLALTGMNRGDRQLVLLALESLHLFLVRVIANSGGDSRAWRALEPRFLPGLAREGQEFLVRESIWPEAYVLGQLLKIMENASKHQHEILAEMASHLLLSTQMAVDTGMDRVTELHQMAFNTLMRDAVEDQDLRRFQNLSACFRQLIEVLVPQSHRMHEAVQHLIHYAKLADRAGMPLVMETVVYDLAETVLTVGRCAPGPALEIIQAWAGPLWQESLEGPPHLRKVAWRALVRVHWEAKAAGLEAIRESVYWRFLTDDAIHREQIELVLAENRELHTEFNDRIMKFGHISPEAERLAQEFLADLPL